MKNSQKRPYRDGDGRLIMTNIKQWPGLPGDMTENEPVFSAQWPPVMKHHKQKSKKGK